MKFGQLHAVVLSHSRPRMGAWIEIEYLQEEYVMEPRRPRMGAWIEIAAVPWSCYPWRVAPVWGGGVKKNPGGSGPLGMAAPPHGGGG
mgnify:CR=1 FL=1